MAKTKYQVSLSEEERKVLQQIIDDSTAHKKTILRAKVLLLSDSKKYTVLEMAEALGTTHTTVQTIRTEYAQSGLDATLERKKRTVSTETRRINDAVIGEILKLLEETPPKGRKRWSLRLLCEASVDRGLIDHISPATMRTVLKRFGVELREIEAFNGYTGCQDIENDGEWAIMFK